MIPEFPQFKKLELKDKEWIENITSKYPPYSDFNFVSMWSWDTMGETRISQHNGNLIVRFNDYLTCEPFYSFLGNNNVNDTAKKIFEYVKKTGSVATLKLVPEDSIKDLDKSIFSIEEDADNFDYVYSTEKISGFSGAEHANSRRLTNRFIRTNPDICIKLLDLTRDEDSNHVLKLNDSWEKNKKSNLDIGNQEKALMRLILAAKYFSLTNVGVFINNELVSFTINEKLNNQYSISHFAKFNIKYSGAYLHSMKVTTEKLFKEGYEYINCEQDLGLLGLRSSKKALCPIFFLKKYFIRER